MKVVDVFCGIGGLTYGLNQAGLNVIAGVDIDGSCRFAFERNNNAIFIEKSIKDIDYSSDLASLFGNEELKILVGCAPCQPFSNHKKDKKSKKHKDWNLINEFLRIVKDMMPEIVSMENVPNLVKQDIFLQFKNSLEELGYHVTFKIQNIAELGVPQQRRRMILLASRIGNINFLPIDNIKKITVRDAIAHLPKIEAGEKCFNDPIHISSKLSPLNLERIKQSKEGGTWRDWDKSLLPMCYRKKSGATYSSVYGRMSWDKVAPTLTTQFINYGTGRYGHPDQNRAISLREGAIIQSFPESYCFVDPKSNFSLQKIARQIGNAVPPKLGMYIGECIIAHVNERR